MKKKRMNRSALGFAGVIGSLAVLLLAAVACLIGSPSESVRRYQALTQTAAAAPTSTTQPFVQPEPDYAVLLPEPTGAFSLVTPAIVNTCDGTAPLPDLGKWGSDYTESQAPRLYQRYVLANINGPCITLTSAYHQTLVLNNGTQVIWLGDQQVMYENNTFVFDLGTRPYLADSLRGPHQCTSGSWMDGDWIAWFIKGDGDAAIPYYDTDDWAYLGTVPGGTVLTSFDADVALDFIKVSVDGVLVQIHLSQVTCME